MLRRNAAHRDRSAERSRCRRRETARSRQRAAKCELRVAKNRLKNSIRGNTTGNFLKQRRTLWIWLIVILLGFVLTIAAFHFDSVVQAWQHQHRIKNIKVLSRNVTRGTDWPSHVIAGLLLAAIAWWRGNKKWTRIFLAMVIAG